VSGIPRERREITQRTWIGGDDLQDLARRHSPNRVPRPNYWHRTERTYAVYGLIDFQRCIHWSFPSRIGARFRLLPGDSHVFERILALIWIPQFSAWNSWPV
jgi:hypothetical protein